LLLRLQPRPPVSRFPRSGLSHSDFVQCIILTAARFAVPASIKVIQNPPSGG
jgi:hypothetical protein